MKGWCGVWRDPAQIIKHWNRRWLMNKLKKKNWNVSKHIRLLFGNSKLLSSYFSPNALTRASWSASYSPPSSPEGPLCTAADALEWPSDAHGKDTVKEPGSSTKVLPCIFVRLWLGWSLFWGVISELFYNARKESICCWSGHDQGL